MRGEARISGLHWRRAIPLLDLADPMLPDESSVMIARLVFSGVFDRFPDLKSVIHHCGP
jgi:predicted TIM-barrel fold metal-dependent hydrolase